MPIVIDNQDFYKTAEVCLMIGIRSNTLFRWLKEEMVSNVEYRDWRGWRLFTAAQMETVRAKTNFVTALSRTG